MARDRFGDRDRGRRGSSRRRSREGDGEKSSKGGLFGRRKRKSSDRDSGRGSRRGGIDFGALDDDSLDGEDRYDDDDDGGRVSRPRERQRRAPRRQRLTLMDLCTPVFGYAAVLPQEPQDPQPPYRQFRDEVLAALKRIETEASAHGIETSDATHAVYALCFFMDTQVASSAWNAASEWATEPLGIVQQRDPEGGVNFFRRLEAFGDREKAVKEVYLVCLSLGFRGKFAELEPTEQAARIGEVRQQLVHAIRPEPLDKLPELFPEAYAEAEQIEDEVPRPPGWWLFASMGIVAASLIVWFGFFAWAKHKPRAAAAQVESVLESRGQR